MVITRLQRDVGRRASGSFARITQRLHFRMRSTKFSVKAAADDAALLDENAPHHRIWLDKSATIRREVERLGHERDVVFRPACHR